MDNVQTISYNEKLKALIDAFKIKDLEEPFLGYYELYKWEIITSVKGKSVENLVVTLVKNSNLLNRYARIAINDILKEPNNKTNFLQAVENLLDEHHPLDERMDKYVKEVKTLTVGKASAYDDRTAGAFLACAHPQIYPLYMKNILYMPLCTYLGKKIKTGRDAYFDYLDIIRIMAKLVHQDGELTERIATRTNGFEQSDLLTAQTIIFCMQKQMNEINIMENKKYTEQIEHLRKCKNMVLTGAPGTGKTFMAKAIAEEMGAESCFVQFHPSYDYTDFVEGLRPIKDDNGNIEFERKDGVFKAFCAKAAQNAIDSEKTVETLEKEFSIKDRIETYLNDLIENSNMLSTKTGTGFYVVGFNDKAISIEMPDNIISKKLQISMSDIVELLENDVPLNNVKDIKAHFARQFGRQDDSYIFVLCNEIRKMQTGVKKTVHLVDKKDYVFIIDEINRGEISKIFGELFFAIDPGYRGTKGRVNTQYQNMVTEKPFAEGFYVPDNVYIIGTMNDIDRSVESMDFAIRRRFAWVEVKASDTAENILKGKPYKDEALRRMESLNNTIEEMLGTAYQIGGSYFLKLDDYNGDFSQLWKFHLKGVLAEYLRGMRDASSKMDKLEQSYNA